ncbi:MAG: transposase family protein [Moorea sp. SIOASIH]|nr:transposase family protein [Moorena sp. SIOASIH]
MHKRGKRYPLWLILLLVIMATMSDCYGYRALEDFARRHNLRLARKLRFTTNGFSLRLDVSEGNDEY